MSNYKFTSDLMDDVLFRSGEKIDGSSDFDAAALRYINRAYQAVWMGGSEFDSTINDTWWWLRSEATIIMDVPITTGTVSVTNLSTTATLSSAPTASMENWFFKTSDEANVFRVSSHTAGTTGLTLEATFTGSTNATAEYKLFRLEYDLPTAGIKILDPMNAYKDSRHEITGTSLRDIENTWPLNLMESGVPSRFAMVDNNTLRFNRSGTTDATNGVKIDYNYLVRPDDLTDSGSEEPLVPMEYRRLLSDIALFWLYADKNDDRAAGVGQGAKALLRAMSRENRSRWANWGDYATIRPRISNASRIRPLRTESGMIIG